MMIVKIGIIFLILLPFVFFPSIANADLLDLSYSEIFDNHKLVRLIIDVETGELIKVNKEAIAFYGYTRDDLLKMKITDINTLSPEDTRNEWEAAAKEERNQFHFRHRLASGEIREVEVYSHPIFHDGKSYLYSIVIDVTEAVAAEKRERNHVILNYFTFLVIGLAMGWVIFLTMRKKKYKKMSHFDQLTNVYSRHYLDVWQQTTKNHKNKMSEVLSVVMLDIDGFKQINDSFGHLIGDQVLVEVANILQHSVRDSDLVIRYGGDEFILILEKTTETESQCIMERVKKELLYMSNFNFSVDISYGIIEMHEKSNIFSAIGLADEKMYEMKKISESNHVNSLNKAIRHD